MAKDFKFEDNSEKIKGELFKAGEAGMEAALLMIEASAKAKAAVDTGELRDKIDHKVETNGNELIGKVGSPNQHAIYIEYGTGEFATNGAGRKGGWVYRAPNGEWHFTYGQAPQPFLRPAFRENKKNVQDIIGKEYGARFKGK